MGAVLICDRYASICDCECLLAVSCKHIYGTTSHLSVCDRWKSGDINGEETKANVSSCSLFNQHLSVLAVAEVLGFTLGFARLVPPWLLAAHWLSQHLSSHIHAQGLYINQGSALLFIIFQYSKMMYDTGCSRLQHGSRHFQCCWGFPQINHLLVMQYILQFLPQRARNPGGGW